jgi:hypothetical protein
MVEKADAGGDIRLAGAIEADLDLDLGFAGFPPDGCGPHGTISSKRGPFNRMMTPSPLRDGRIVSTCATAPAREPIAQGRASA